MKFSTQTILALFVIIFVINAGATTYYVNVANSSPAPPYTNWPSAATDIQSAIDVATNGDLILVTNGLYNTGGRAINGFTLTNRVSVTKPLIEGVPKDKMRPLDFIEGNDDSPFSFENTSSGRRPADSMERLIIIGD